MPQVINRVPPGLLSLLDIKSMGVNPVQLADLLSPTIELADLYLQAIASPQSGLTAVLNATGAASPATGNSFRPGPGELWVVTKCCVSGITQNPAATTYRVAACVYDASLGPVVQVGASNEGNAGDWVAASIDSPVILTPGLGLGVFVHDVALGTGIQFRIAGTVAVLRF